MRKLFLLFSLFLSTSYLFGQYTVVEDFIANPQQNNGAISNIPYAKYLFDNGLILIINEDHSDPAVSMTVVHKNGSSASPADRTNMMYLIAESLYGKGNTNITQLEKLGLSFTWKIDPDMIKASYTFSKDLLPAVLYVESKTLKNFINTYDQEKFDNGRITLINSMDQLLGSDLFYIGYAYAKKALYPMGHPYGWHTEGLKEQTENLALEDVQKFYHEWFGSNNIIISISGDVNKEDILKKIKQLFSDLPRAIYGPLNIQSNIALRDADDQTMMKSPRYITLTHESNKAPKLLMIFPVAKAFANESFYFKLAADFLGNPEYGIVSTALKDAKMASDVKITYQPYKYSGEFRFEITAFYNVSLLRIKDSISSIMSHKLDMSNPDIHADKSTTLTKADGSVDEIRPQNIMDLLINASLHLQLNLLKNLETTAKKSDLLSSYEFYMNNPNYLNNEFSQMFSNDPVSFQSIIRSSLVDVPFVAISILHQDQTNLRAGADNFTIKEPEAIITHASAEEIKAFKSPESPFKMPKIKKKTKFASGSSLLRVLDNKCVFISNNDPQSNVINLRYTFPLSDKYEIVSNPVMEKFLIDIFTDKFSVLENGEFQKRFLLSGSTLDIYVKDNTLIFDVFAQIFNINAIKEMMREFLTQPAPISFDLIKKAEEMLADKESLGVGIDQVFKIIMFNKLYSYNLEGRPPVTGGVREQLTMSLINLAEIIPSIISLDRALIIINGHINPADLMDFQETYRHFEYVADNRTIPVDKIPSITAPLPGKTYFINRESKQDVNLLINFLNINNNNMTDVYLADFLAFILSDAHNNLLQQSFSGKEYVKSLQVEEVLTSGIKSYYLKAAVTEESLTLFIQEVNNLFNNLILSPPDKNQLKEWKLAYAFRIHVSQESIVQKSDFLQFIHQNNYPGSYQLDKDKQLKKISKGSLKKYVSLNINSKQNTYLLIGNKERLQDKMGTAGLTDIEYINVFGNKITKKEDK